MKFNMELEDILYTMKNKDAKPSEDTPKEESATVSAPEPPASEKEVAPPELAPPKPKTEVSAAEEPEELVWLERKPKKRSEEDAVPEAQKPEKKKKEKKERPPLSLKDIKARLVALYRRFLTEFLPNLKQRLQTKRGKQVLTGVGAVVLVFLLVFGSVKIVQYTKAATLKKYSEQYAVEYPEGIRREFYDAFGENPSFAGNVVIKDTDTDCAVYSKPGDGEGLLEKGSTVYQDQHYRAIALSKDQADLEKVYATPEGYVDATQTITFRTLFDDEKYHVIAAYYTNTRPEDDGGYLFPYNCYGNFTEDSRFQYQDRIKTRSLYSTGYLIQPEDYCLTVSVDSDIMPAYRFVVVGVKVKNNVKKIKKTEENKDIHYPQSYCDKLGIHNRYWLAGHWYPEIYTDADQTETAQLTIDDFLTEE